MHFYDNPKARTAGIEEAELFFHQEYKTDIDHYIRSAARKAIYKTYRKLRQTSQQCPQLKDWLETGLDKDKENLLLLCPAGKKEFCYTHFSQKLENYIGFSLFGQSSLQGSDPFFRYLNDLYVEAYENEAALLSISNAFQTNRLYGYEFLILPVMATPDLKLLAVLASPIRNEAMLIPALLSTIQSHVLVITMLRNSNADIHDARIVEASQHLRETFNMPDSSRMQFLSDFIPELMTVKWAKTYHQTIRTRQPVSVTETVALSSEVTANHIHISPFGDGVILHFGINK